MMNTTSNTCDDWKTLPKLTTPIVAEYDTHYEKFSEQTSPTSAHQEALEVIADNFHEEANCIREENIHLHNLLDQRTAEIQHLQRMVQERDATIIHYENYNIMQKCDEDPVFATLQATADPLGAGQWQGDGAYAAEETALAKSAEVWASTSTNKPKKVKVKVSVQKKKTATDMAAALAKTKKQAERDAKKAKKEAEKATAKAEREANKAKKEAEKVALKAKKEAEKALKKVERDALNAVKLAEKDAEKAQKLADKQAEKDAKMAAAKETKMVEKEAKKAQKEAEMAAKTPVKRATPPMAIWQRDNKESISAQVKADTSGDNYFQIVGRIWKSLAEDTQSRYKQQSKAEKDALEAASATA